MHTPPISDEESQRRQAAIDFARGSVRMEGFVLPAEAEPINQRYVHGEITTAQHVEAIKALASNA